LFAVGAQAALIAQDDFNSYSDGALAGQGGWTTAFGTGNNVVGGVVDAQGSGADYLSLPAALGDAGTVWFAVDFGTSTDQSTWAGLSFFAPTAGASRTERVLIGDRSGADVWGIAIPSGNYNNSTNATLGLKTGVGRITLGAGTTSSIELWVGSDAVTAVDISGTADAALSGLELYDVDKIRLGAGADSYLYDNFILGDTYQDVGAIPEPATLGLIGLCGGAMLFMRRRFMM
jgi:hypothetical protein